MKKPEKPDAEAFARTVLWHLTEVIASTITIEKMLAELTAHLKQESAEEVEARYEYAKVQTANDLYRTALRKCGIKP